MHTHMYMIEEVRWNTPLMARRGAKTTGETALQRSALFTYTYTIYYIAKIHATAQSSEDLTTYVKNYKCIRSALCDWNIYVYRNISIVKEARKFAIVYGESILFSDRLAKVYKTCCHGQVQCRASSARAHRKCAFWCIYIYYEYCNYIDF